MSQPSQFYRKCSTCKEPIAFGAEYYVCSVTTCNRPKLAMYFCSLPCWEAHVPEARHRDAWAEPRTAPLKPEPEEAPVAMSRSAVEGAPPAHRNARMVDQLGAAKSPPESESTADEDEVLVVVSKLKKYVRDHSGMNTSDTAIPVLSDHLRRLAREAVRNAARDGRKTVMDRDFLPLLKG